MMAFTHDAIGMGSLTAFLSVFFTFFFMSLINYNKAKFAFVSLSIGVAVTVAVTVLTILMSGFVMIPFLALFIAQLFLMFILSEDFDIKGSKAAYYRHSLPLID